MVSRSIQEQSNALLINIPKALADSLGLRRGDRMNVKLVSGKIELEPVHL
jgi:AbrB family looped-hinge helix DNA binding protein